MKSPRFIRLNADDIAAFVHFVERQGYVSKEHYPGPRIHALVQLCRAFFTIDAEGLARVNSHPFMLRLDSLKADRPQPLDGRAPYSLRRTGIEFNVGRDGTLDYKTVKVNGSVSGNKKADNTGHNKKERKDDTKGSSKKSAKIDREIKAFFNRPRRKQAL